MRRSRRTGENFFAEAEEKVNHPEARNHTVPEFFHEPGHKLIRGRCRDTRSEPLTVRKLTRGTADTFVAFLLQPVSSCAKRKGWKARRGRSGRRQEREGKHSDRDENSQCGLALAATPPVATTLCNAACYAVTCEKPRLARAPDGTLPHPPRNGTTHP